MMYQAAVLRPDLPKMVDILSEVIRRPLHTQQELDDVKLVAQYEMADMEWNIHGLLPEKLHQIAFGGLASTSKSNRLFGKKLDGAAIPSGQTLGKPMLCDPTHLQNITPQTLQDFQTTWFTSNKLVLAGVGMPHAELVQLAQQCFGDMSPVSQELLLTQERLLKRAEYTGGVAVIDTTGAHISPNPDDRPLTHIHIAFEAPSMTDPDAYALATLSTLMGGGGSFSAG
jgi:mitochondrial-processing peptidase subunit alpha